MLSTILLVLFYFLTPLLILYLCRRFTLLSKLGSVLIAYIVGLLVATTGLLPSNAHEVQEIITMITVPLAIPLLLFSSDIRSWSRLAGKTILSMVIAVASVIVVVITGFLLFRDESLPELWKIGGMLIGVYTGGTPNLAALKIMLDVDTETYLLVHAYDMAISAAYFLFLITAGQRVFGLFLPRFPFQMKQSGDQAMQSECSELFWGLLRKENRVPILKALGVSILIFGLAGLTTLVVPENLQMVVVILIITTLGIVVSMVPAIHKLPKTFELGMYLILVFSIDVASMVDFTELIHTNLTILYYVSFAIFVSLVLHVSFSSLFRIDTDTVMVTSTALICSPPFVPVVAGAIRNREVVVSGLTVGIIGYAVGNYLGVLVAGFLKTL